MLFVVSYTFAVSLFYGLTLSSVSAYWAKLIADTICFFINFAVMRQWVYRHAGDGAAVPDNEPKQAVGLPDGGIKAPGTFR